jgi:hypothetical protein
LANRARRLADILKDTDPRFRRQTGVSNHAIGAQVQVQGGEAVRRELNVLALIKGSERYVYVYDDDSRASLIDTFRDQAADPQLSFSWFDAAVLTEKAREQARQGGEVGSPSRTRI